VPLILEPDILSIKPEHPLPVKIEPIATFKIWARMLGQWDIIVKRPATAVKRRDSCQKHQQKTQEYPVPIFAS
jgi:hypothetical protein